MHDHERGTESEAEESDKKAVPYNLRMPISKSKIIVR